MGLLEGEGSFSIVRAAPNSRRGWRSQYYGAKEPAISVLLETDQPRVCFWTFFGFAADSIELRGNDMKIRFDGGETSIGLTELNK